MHEMPDVVEDLWERLTAAADDRAHPMHLVTLATVGTDGGPDARLMVLRGARRPGRLWFHTDRRSHKMEQIAALPEGCVVAYDHRDGVQVRAWGTISLHIDDDCAEQHWQQTDFAIRHAFALPLAPGQPLPHPDPRMAARHRVLHTDERAGRENFVVLELTAHRLEWLRVDIEGDVRARMERADGWMVRALMP